MIPVTVEFSDPSPLKRRSRSSVKSTGASDALRTTSDPHVKKCLLVSYVGVPLITAYFAEIIKPGEVASKIKQVKMIRAINQCA